MKEDQRESTRNSTCYLCTNKGTWLCGEKPN